MLYQIIKFIMVGFGNTIIGMAAIFIFYNLCGFGYWLASGLGFGVGSIWSYFLNKYFTFQNKEKSLKLVVKFIINITVCYAVAYGVAKPLTIKILSGMAPVIQDNVAMLVGMGLFVILNYFGQRFLIFNKKED